MLEQIRRPDPRGRKRDQGNYDLRDDRCHRAGVGSIVPNCVGERAGCRIDQRFGASAGLKLLFAALVLRCRILAATSHMLRCALV